MLLLGSLFAKRYMGIGSILMILFQGFFINQWQRLLLEVPWLFSKVYWKIAVAVLSYFCRCFGGALSTSVCLETAGFEACLFALADRIKIEYKYLKFLSEALFFESAFFAQRVWDYDGCVRCVLRVWVKLLYDWPESHGVETVGHCG